MPELKPRRELNLAQTSAIIIGTVIGSGVFISLPIVAAIAGSPGMSVLIWFIGGLLWIPQILILAELGTAYPDQGFGYYYLKEAGSPLLAFVYTWTVFLTSDTPTLTIIGLSTASILTFFFPALEIPLYARIFASILILGLALINYRSVKTGGNFQIVLTLAKLTPLIAVVIIGFFFLNSGNIYIAPAADFIEEKGFFLIITAGISSTLWSYAGFGNILYMAGEVKNPSSTLPKALIGSMFFVMAAYTLISLGASAIVPFQDLVSAQGEFVNPFAYMDVFKSFAGTLFAIAATISMIGVLNASIMAQPRLEYAIARDGLFFEVFGKLHPKYLTPANSIMIQAVLSIALFLLGDIENMLGYFTLSYVLQNILVYGSIFFLRKKSDYKPSYKAPAWYILAIVSILIQLYIAYGTFIAYPVGGVLASFGLIISGLPIYFYFYKFHLQKRKNG